MVSSPVRVWIGLRGGKIAALARHHLVNPPPTHLIYTNLNLTLNLNLNLN